MLFTMKPLERIKPILNNEFKNDPRFYKIYEENKKLNITFQDMVMAIVPMGWDIYFVEIYHRRSPTENQLAYAKLCKNQEELLKMVRKARDSYEKPELTEPKDRIGFTVDLKHHLEERLKDHPKFVKVFSGYEKQFIVYDDILILIEPMGGSFYNWELFKREGELEVKHQDNGAKVGYKKIVDVIDGLRRKYDKEE